MDVDWEESAEVMNCLEWEDPEHITVLLEPCLPMFIVYRYEENHKDDNDDPAFTHYQLVRSSNLVLQV